MSATRKLSAFLLGYAFVLSYPAMSQNDAGKYNALAQRVNQGVKLMRVGRYQSAMAEFQAAKAIDPKNSILNTNIAECFNNMGVELFNKRNYAQAQERFEQCLELMPQHPGAKRNINLCRQRMQMQANDDFAGGMDDLDSMKTPPPAIGAEKRESSVSRSAAGPKDPSAPVKNLAGDPASAAASSQSAKSAPADSKASGKELESSAAIILSKPSAESEPLAPCISAPADSKDANINAVLLSPVKVPELNDLTQRSQSSAGVESYAFPQDTKTNVQKPLAVENAPEPSRIPAVPEPQSKSEGDSFSTVSGQGSPDSSALKAREVCSLEERISAIELKVYGQKNEGLPLMKRIEKLETDFAGQIRAGSMSERVDFLKKSIGQR